MSNYRIIRELIVAFGVLLLTACVGSNLNGNVSNYSPKPYKFAQDVILKNSNESGLNPWKTGFYSFARENCLNGEVVSSKYINLTESPVCEYTNIKYNNSAYVVTESDLYINDTKGFTTLLTESSGIKYSMKSANKIYILTNNNNFYLCDLSNSNSECGKVPGEYIDMMAIEFNGSKCQDEACKKDGLKYDSVLLITKYTSSSAQTSGSYNVTSKMYQFFSSGDSIDGLDRSLEIGNNKYAIMELLAIKNDLPIREKLVNMTSVPDVINLSFATVGNESFAIDFTAIRHKNFGVLHQVYFGDFNGGGRFIKPNISKNEHPFRVNSRDHITITSNNQVMPKFEGTETFAQLVNDVRQAAGGPEDTGNRYKFCEGDMGYYCYIGKLVGKGALSNLNTGYFRDAIDNTIFIGLMIPAFHLSNGVATRLMEKLKDVSAGNAVMEALVKVGNSTIVAPLSFGGTMLTVSLLAPKASELFYSFINEKDISASGYTTFLLKNILLIPPVTGTCSTGVATCSYSSTCEDKLLGTMYQIEYELRMKSSYEISATPILDKRKTVYDIYSSISECKNQSRLNTLPEISQKQIDYMKRVTFSSIADYASNVLILGLMKYVIFTDNESSVIALPGNGDVNIDSGKYPGEQKEAEVADIRYLIPNCSYCSTAYVLDHAGNKILDKNGKQIVISNGDFTGVSYEFTHEKVVVPIISRLAGIAPNGLRYSSSVYQLSISCEDFNNNMKNITGTNEVNAVFAQLPDKGSSRAMIIGNDGKVCNYKMTKFEVKRYDPGIVSEIFLFVPFSLDLAAYAAFVAFNYAMTIPQEVTAATIAAISDSRSYYMIRNGHYNDPTKDDFNCKQLPLKARSDEKGSEVKETFRQISKSTTSNAFWIMGENGLYYLNTSNFESYIFDFNTYGSAVFVSMNEKLNGKLYIGTYLSDYSRQYKYVETYNENTLINSYKNNSGASRKGYYLKMEGFREDSLKHTDGPGMYKIYGGMKEDEVWMLYNGNLIYSWDLISNKYNGLIVKLPARTNNLAITSQGEMVFVTKDLTVYKLSDRDDPKYTIKQLVKINAPTDIENNPYIFTVEDSIFVINDDRNVYEVSQDKMEYKYLGNAGGVDMHYPVTDVIAKDNGNVYILTENALNQCKILN